MIPIKNPLSQHRLQTHLFSTLNHLLQQIGLLPLNTLSDNVTLNPAIFLYDSNGKFLKEKKIFPSNQEILIF